MSTTSDRSLLPRRQFLRRMGGAAGGLLVTAVAAACGANKAASTAAPASSASAATTGAPATTVAASAATTAKVTPATTAAAKPATTATSTAPAAAPSPAGGAAFDAAKELAISFSYVADTAGAGGGRRINNPYVVVFIENAAGEPVRSISLNYQIGRGDRYLRDLTRWSRTAQTSAAVETISSATKVPGAYKVVWDGTDDKKAPVPQGDYFVCIEAAREHGPYEIVREQISIGAEPFVKPLAAKGELQDVTVELRARS